jgi:hypothetical protein
MNMPKRERPLLSCSPDVLAHPLDPVTQLINAAVPFPQSSPHVANLCWIQNLGLYPVDSRNFSDLIDGAPQQPQAKRLHDQMLNLIILDLRLRRDSVEAHSTIMRWALEHCLRQRRQTHFLIQQRLEFLEDGDFANVAD